MAIDEANEAGGYEGLPFRLVPVWSEDPWGTGVARLSQAVYRDGLLAILGTMGLVGVAINDAMAEWDAPLCDGDTVLLFPPVAGG